VREERGRPGEKIIPSCLWRGQAAAGANYSDMLTISTLKQREKGTGLSNPYFVSRWNSSRGVCLQPPSHSAEELDSNHSASTVNSTSLEKHPYITLKFVSFSVIETGMHFAIAQRGTATPPDNENKAVNGSVMPIKQILFRTKWILDATA